MPPRKGPRNVVSNGNAGNSSKSKAAEPPVEDPTKPPRPPPLFPLGYKTPISLLSEKCQKNGWEKPVIESRKNSRTDPETYTAVITLKKRVSKNIYNLDEVRFMPVPRIEATDPQMAKHLGATYALFRFCSGLPMAMVLPPTIRPYWTTLLAEKASAPAHQDWQWAEDPFAAQKEVEARQKKRSDRIESASSAADGYDDRGMRVMDKGKGKENGGGGGRSWESAPEVKMTPAQRELVESVIRKMMSKFPNAVLEAARDSAATPSTATSGTNTPAFDPGPLQQQLTTLGFRPAHVISAISALTAAHQRLHSGTSSSTKDPLMLSLSFLSPLEAAIEWLMVHLPEDDLPSQYKPSSSANDFVSGLVGGGGGKDALRLSWVVDKLVKKAGFPRKAVEDVLSGGESRETVALDLLGRRMCGWVDGEDGWGELEYGQGWAALDLDEEEERKAARQEELMVLSSVLGDRLMTESEEEFDITIPYEGKEDLSLHIIFSQESCYPSTRFPSHPPSFYLLSNTLPSYIKLHLHAQLLRSFRDPERPDMQSVLESGVGGAVYLMTEFLEMELPIALENPPDIGKVTQYLTPRPVEQEGGVVNDLNKPAKKKVRARGPTRTPTPAEQEAVKQKLEAIKSIPGYQKMMDVRSSLPAWQERENIIQLLETNRMLVVVGETGCGKSTQLPQFILDHEILAGRGASTNIICTQPRRVSALGLAARVGEERMENIDKEVESVGYVIRGESKMSKDTRLTFMTTGVLLRRLGSGGDVNLDNISHILVDEVHERNVDSDLLLLLLRDLMTRNQRIKVILMSATINKKIFVDYFNGAPLLEIPGRTYPVEDHYLEDILPLLPNYRPEPNRFAKQTEEQKKKLREELEKLQIDERSKRSLEILSTVGTPYDLVAEICAYINSSTKSTDGGILIFMSGVMEIKQTISALQSKKLGQVEIMALHANLSPNEQKKVFAKTSGRKIVVATNIAETSVTISDIVYVIDSGKLKEVQYDPDLSMSKLDETYTSRAASRQRRGRAGRTQPGICYKLFTRLNEENNMPNFSKPEMLRTPLEALFLQVKAMNQDEDVGAFLRKAIDPPNFKALDTAWRTLQDLGAVEGDSMSSRLTALGTHMSALPVDLRLAKLLVLGCVFKALDPCLTIAAMLSSKPLFSGPMDKREEMKKARASFAWGKSDLLTNLKAYQAASEVKGFSAMRNFCDENFINSSTIRDISSLRQDFIGALSEIGFVGRDMSALNVNSENENLLKGILAGALFPRIARISLPDAKFEKLQAGSLQIDHEAKAVKFFDGSGRVFIHPGSLLFSESNYKPGFLTYFHKAETSKVFLFDATEIPHFALLLFGGPVTINHFSGGLTVGKDGAIRLRAWARIGVLVNQLRRLLDAELYEAVEKVNAGGLVGSDVVGAMLALLG